MHSPKRIKVTEVNPHLICVLCRGYYIDATTIIECLHSFCKSCIVKYLQTNKYCPICDVQVHKTAPLLNIRSDKTLQNIVYKLVPSLFKSEMERRSAFYRLHPDYLPSVAEDRGEVCDSTPIFLPDEILIICLEYLSDKPAAECIPKRFLHCPAEMTLAHLVKLIRGKFDLLPTHQVNVLFKDDVLPEYLTIMEVAYTYQCRRKIPIHLFYRILELKKTTIRLLEVKEKKEEPIKSQSSSDETNKKDKSCNEEVTKRAEKRSASTPLENCPVEKSLIVEKSSPSDNADQCGSKDDEWKGVQLQISENGVMSFRDMKNSECSPKPAVEAPQAGQGASSPTVAQLSASMSSVATPVTASSEVVVAAPTTKATTSNGPLVSLPSELTTSIVPANYSGPPRIPSSKPILSVSKVTKDQVKKDFNNVEANKLSISRVPAAGFKEKGEALNKIVSKLSPNERVIGNTSVTIRPVLSSPQPVKTYQPAPQPHQPQLAPKVQKAERKPQQAVRYKTLTSPTKQWNPSIDRTTMLTMKQNYDMSKPPRFFKMRNMPRYLGNPASGVKPMYGTSGEEAPKEQKPRSPTKLPPPFTPGSPKGGKSPFSDKTTWTPRVPSPAHSGSLYSSNPYLLYSGFPGSFNPDPALLANANPDLVRSMLANSAYHPSLPPSINMLFNPHHSVPRPPLESPPSVQRIPRTKSPSKSDEKVEKPIPNLIPANLPSSHVPRSPTMSQSALSLPPSGLSVPSIPPHPSHPPGSLLPPGASALPLRLPPPLSIASPMHHHNSLLHPPPHLSPHHPLGSPRASSPAGSPRTGSPLHTSPPKQPMPSPSSSFSPTKSKSEQKSPNKTEKPVEQDKKTLSTSSTPPPPASTPTKSIPAATSVTTTTSTTSATPLPVVTSSVSSSPSPSPAPAAVTVAACDADQPKPVTSVTEATSTSSSISPTTAPGKPEPKEPVKEPNDEKPPPSKSLDNNNLCNDKDEKSSQSHETTPVAPTAVSEGN